MLARGITLALIPLAGFVAFARAAVVVPAGFVNETLFSGIDQPNSMAFLPDGRLLFTEQRSGSVRLLTTAGIVSLSTPLASVPELVSSGFEQGLQGIAVDPGWPSRPYVYLYHNSTNRFCRLVRYTASGTLSNASSPALTLTTPLILIDDIPDNDPRHNAGCLRFGPDGKLYVSVGDDEDKCGAQDSTVLKGAILRLDVSGLGPAGGGPVARSAITPADNPLSSTNDNARLVFAYGLRNPWRFHVDRVTGLLYGVDVGEVNYEEVNEIHAGDDLGWPYLEGPLDMGMSCTFDGRLPYRAPIHAEAHDGHEIAIVGAGIYRRPTGQPNAFPTAYEGDVFYAEYYSGRLRRLHRTGPTWGLAAPVSGQPETDVWATGLVTAVDFLEATDGSLWWMSQYDEAFSSSSGAIHRIRAGPGTLPPPDTVRVALSGAPNPFATTTNLLLRLSSSRPVTLAIYDLSGRRLRTLFKGLAGPGDPPIQWDGTDDQGRAVPTGVYLARLDARGIEASARILRLR
jgi:glucose/arabinose dehydrogenase